MATSDQVLMLARAAVARDHATVAKALLQIAAHDSRIKSGRFSDELRKLAGMPAPELLEILSRKAGEVGRLVEQRAPRSKALPDLRLTEQASLAVDTFVRQYCQREALLERNIPVARRLLLTGPPGCGKTSLAGQVAETLGLPLLVVRLDALVDSHLGVTTRNLRKLFDAVREVDAVWFLDEVDAVASARTGGGGGAEREYSLVVTSLLTMLDTHAEGVLICATNRTDKLDAAFVRRFDTTLELAAPAPSAAVQLMREVLLRCGFRFQHICWNGVAGRLQQLSFSQAERAAWALARETVIAGVDERKVTEEDVVAALLAAGGVPAAVPNPHPDGCHTLSPEELADCTTDGHFSCATCTRRLPSAKEGEE